MTDEFIPLESERLRLRRFRASDLETFLAYRADPQVARYQGWEDYTRADAQAFLERQLAVVPGTPGCRAQIAIERKDTGAMIGDLYLFTPEDEPPWAQIGFTLQRASQGRGYATEAVRRLLDHAFGPLARHRVTALADAANARSIALLERVGMRREAHFVENVRERGAWRDEVAYAILQREWPTPDA